MWPSGPASQQSGSRARCRSMRRDGWYPATQARKRMRLKTLTAMALVVGLVLGLMTVVPAQQKVNLVFSAGPTGGSWTPMAAATAEVIKKKYPELDVLVEPGAALVNMEKMRNDKADIAWSMTTVMADARAGVNSWKGKQTDKALRSEEG